ncbi:MAG: hypothetical protein IPL74_02970 [Bacteroidetes bacterium]|nr:hypothetical protein [Bacteroidota bacterium]
MANVILLTILRPLHLSKLYRLRFVQPDLLLEIGLHHKPKNGKNETEKKASKKTGGDFNWRKRHAIIQELLATKCTKVAIWEKYTGQSEEHGQILNWMKKLGYVTGIPIRRPNIVSDIHAMAKHKNKYKTSLLEPLSNEQFDFDTLQLKKRIADLEAKLKEAEIKAIAFSTMVDIAEKEFNIRFEKDQYQTIDEMKSNFPHIGLAKLCGWFGITRQAYYQNSWSGIGISIEEDLVLKEVISIRKNHSRMGARKLQIMLQPFLMEHQIKLGRDGLFDLLAANCMLVKRKKRHIQTTWSHHWLRKYPNLIRGFGTRRSRINFG